MSARVVPLRFGDDEVLVATVVGLAFTAEGKIVVAGASVEASVKITLTYEAGA